MAPSPRVHVKRRPARSRFVTIAVCLLSAGLLAWGPHLRSSGSEKALNEPDWHSEAHQEKTSRSKFRVQTSQFQGKVELEAANLADILLETDKGQEEAARWEAVEERETKSKGASTDGEENEPTVVEVQVEETRDSDKDPGQLEKGIDSDPAVKEGHNEEVKTSTDSIDRDAGDKVDQLAQSWEIGAVDSPLPDDEPEVDEGDLAEHAESRKLDSEFEPMVERQHDVGLEGKSLLGEGDRETGGRSGQQAELIVEESEVSKDVKRTEKRGRAEDLEESEESEGTENVEMKGKSQMANDLEKSEESEESEVTERSEIVGKLEGAEGLEDAKESEVSDRSDDLQKSENSENAENLDNPEGPEISEDSEKSEDTKLSGKLEVEQEGGEDENFFQRGDVKVDLREPHLEGQDTEQAGASAELTGEAGVEPGKETASQELAQDTERGEASGSGEEEEQVEAGGQRGENQRGDSQAEVDGGQERGGGKEEEEEEEESVDRGVSLQQGKQTAKEEAEEREVQVGRERGSQGGDRQAEREEGQEEEGSAREGEREGKGGARQEEGEELRGEEEASDQPGEEMEREGGRGGRAEASEDENERVEMMEGEAVQEGVKGVEEEGESEGERELGETEQAGQERGSSQKGGEDEAPVEDGEKREGDEVKGEEDEEGNSTLPREDELAREGEAANMVGSKQGKEVMVEKEDHGEERVGREREREGSAGRQVAAVGSGKLDGTISEATVAGKGALEDEGEAARRVQLEVTLVPQQPGKKGTKREEGSKASGKRSKKQKPMMRVRVSPQCAPGQKLPGGALYAGWPGAIQRLPDTWRTPALRDFRESAAHPKCAGLVPAAEPGVLPPDYSQQPIRNIDDLVRAAEEGQRLLVVAPRFGLGNSLRSYASAWTYALLTNRRIVILNAGLHHGVYITFCQAFHCGFDHILPQPPEGPWNTSVSDDGSVPPDGEQPDKILSPGSLWRAFLKHVPYKNVESSAVGRGPKGLWDKTPILFTHNYAMWDSFYKGNRPLLLCAMAACACRSSACIHSRAMAALIGGGPTEALRQTISEVLWVHRRVKRDETEQPGDATSAGTMSSLLLDGQKNGENEGESESGSSGWVSQRWSETELATGSGLRLRFDFGVHIRTRPTALEMPRECGTHNDACRAKRKELAQRIEEEFFSEAMWCCVGTYIQEVAIHLRRREESERLGISMEQTFPSSMVLNDTSGLGRPLSIFLAIDNEAIRPRIVEYLRQYGDVYYNGGPVAHIAVSHVTDTGRLPTMAEFYLLAKAGTALELSHQLSTFSQIATLLGNGTLVTMDSKPKKCWRIGAKPQHVVVSR